MHLTTTITEDLGEAHIPSTPHVILNTITSDIMLVFLNFEVSAMRSQTHADISYLFVYFYLLQEEMDSVIVDAKLIPERVIPLNWIQEFN